MKLNFIDSGKEFDFGKNTSQYLQNIPMIFLI